MRREGFELQVSRPEVIVRVIDGTPHEPVERAVIDVPNEHVGTVTQAVAPRKGKVTDLRPGDTGRTIVTVVAPARGLLGLRSQLMTTTRGTALVHQHHDGWQPWAGRDAGPDRRGDDRRPQRDRPPGSPSRTCRSAASCSSARREQVYEGMVVGEASRPEQMVVNATKAKELTNIRTHNHDEADQADAAPGADSGDRHRVDRRRRTGGGHSHRHQDSQAATEGTGPQTRPQGQSVADQSAGTQRTTSHASTPMTRNAVASGVTVPS